MKRILIIIFCLWSSGYSYGQETDEGMGEYVLIPAGEFTMGDIYNEGKEDEQPVHVVFVDSFYICKFEVTNQEYKSFIDDRGYAREEFWGAGGFGMFALPRDWRDTTFKGGSFSGNEFYPVVGVSWNEAMAYCNWLSAKTGEKYRLPSEAEWEKAARGGEKRRYPWGENLDVYCTNYNSDAFPYGNGPSPVGFFDGTDWGDFPTMNNASPYGVYDMSGNVAEWCLDYYGKSYYAESPAKNPKGPFYGGYRVVKGGGWNSNPENLRISNRVTNYPHFRYFNTGFRLVREP